MPNTLLTSTIITREALRILHQKLNFVGNINKQYDEKFAKEGAKIGSSLNIRLPNKYVIRRGATLVAQDTTETNTTLQVTNQTGVDLNFTSVDLTLSLDDFSKRVLEPAMAVLASTIESDALAMVLDVYQQVGTPGTVPNTALAYLQAKARLDNSLTPPDRNVLVDPLAQITIVDALKGLFQNDRELAKQYKDGAMGNALGFDWYANTLMPAYTMGNKASGVTVNGASQTGSTLNIGGVAASDTFKKGMVFTIAGVFEVHPETKQLTSRLQNFVVTADATMAGTTGSISISPAIAVTGAQQNVNASPANAAAITIQSGSASTAYLQGIAFHKDAFTFATADLIMPKGLDFAARETYDGISMRIVRQYDINNDKFPCRLDVLYGFKTIRPELACRVTS